MGTYLLKYGGKEKTVSGVNLKTAVEKIGFVVEDIQSDWYRVSNGKYRVICSDGMSIFAIWLEKVEQLKNNN
jgi:hypothetical protein